MSDLEAIADRVEIEALRGEYTDAATMRDFDRFASLFTEDAAYRIPAACVSFSNRAEIRAGIERMQKLWDFFLQTTHVGVIELAGDTATGRAYMAEFGRLRDGGSHSNVAIFHDEYRRTPDGWKFASREYEVRYLDSTPLTGSVPGAVKDS